MCPHNYNYIVSKIFEIPCSGQLLIINRELEEYIKLLGFYDEVNCIIYDYKNISEKLEYILNMSKTKVNTIREKGHKLSNTYHTTKKRCQFINNILNNIYDNVVIE